MTDTNLSAESWSKYWTQASGEVGCLPGAPKALGNLLDGIWSVLGKSLPAGAKVVDLACGNGVAGSAMLGGNTELNMTGVDYAELDDVDTPDFPIIGSTSITKMPLEDVSFDCAISQFGIEYVAADEVGPELTRILKPGAQLQFILHNADSAIVKNNLIRLNILEHIYNSPLIVNNSEMQNLQGLQRNFNDLISKFGEHSLVIEIASAIRSTMNDPEQARRIALRDLWSGMAQEITIIDALKKAALSESGLEDWKSTLGKSFKFNRAEKITYEDNILCWSLSGSKV